MNRSPPGDGVTEINLSVEPLATEGEATPGPDDYNPYEEGDYDRVERESFFGPDLLPEPSNVDLVAHDDTEGVSRDPVTLDPIRDGWVPEVDSLW